MSDEDGFTDEQVHASAVHFLLSEDRKETALVLLSCTPILISDGHWHDTTQYNLLLKGTSQTYRLLSSENNPIIDEIKHAFNVVLPVDDIVARVTLSVKLIDVEPSWKEQMLDIVQGKQVHNQGIDIKDKVSIIWKNLRFRSESERRIAEALDKVGVWYLPNCLGRLGTVGERKNKEADFVICFKGKWGILEVDGEPFHPPTRTVEDHKRDREFLANGIKIVQHYDATECYHAPDRVVRNFLDLLAN